MIKKLFKDTTENSYIQFIRYAFVGGAAFLADFSSLFIFKEFFNLHYLLANAIAFIIGLLTNYFLSISWVFNKRVIGNSWAEFFIFAVIGFIGLGFNELIMWYFTDKARFHYMFSKILATGIVYFWNFFVRKFILFK